MSTLWFAVAFVAFILYTIHVVRKTEELLQDDGSWSAKICIGIDCALCLAGVVLSFLHIRSAEGVSLRLVGGDTYGFGSVVGYLCAWWMLKTIIGGILATVEMCTLLVVHHKLIEKKPRGDFPGSGVLILAFGIAGVMVAIDLILYAFELSDSVIISTLSQSM